MSIEVKGKFIFYASSINFPPPSMCYKRRLEFISKEIINKDKDVNLLRLELSDEDADSFKEFMSLMKKLLVYSEPSYSFELQNDKTRSCSLAIDILSKEEMGKFVYLYFNPNVGFHELNKSCKCPSA